MPFSQLLSKLLDNVNLGKILVDGGPGFLLAVAILLLACHSIPESKTSTLPFLKLVVKTDLIRIRADIENRESKAAQLAGRIAGEDQELQSLAKKIALAEQSRVHTGSGNVGCVEGLACDLYFRIA